MLKLEQVRYHYENGETMMFNLQAQDGEIVAILGPSGAGKSTLMALISGFLTPQSGQIMFNGQVLNQLKPAHRPLSILFQEHNLFPHLTVFANIGLGLNGKLHLSDTQRDTITQVAAQVGLDSFLDRLPPSLSGGQKQRVALARCLARQRPLLLLDEPFSALDPILRQEMLNQVKQLAKEQHITVLMITHNPDDALLISDKCAFVSGGEVVEFGSTQALFHAPAHPELQRYLGLD
ncbi:thiamine ABC transporter ATP-binding protein [Photobacterium damselae]|uniref:thiamine ABC transporter ATP-binding protein n=1 Tax=Photobacterium damselae TaxID=38293 RepID=UPI0040690532